MKVSELIECYWCGGTAVDEEGRLCVACDGTAAVTWKRVIHLDGVRFYPRQVQLEQGAAFVHDATAAIS